MLVAACVATLGGMLVYAAATLPDLGALAASTGTVRILDRHGELIAEITRGGISRRSVPLSRVAPIMRDATLAAEDRNFYHEGAFDYGRVLKALLVDTVARRPEQGASTITQQLAKNGILSSHGGVLRKLREAMLARQIDSRYSKDAILDMYLNIIYYGAGAYGIEDAAQTYFGKHAAALDLREASLLAGLPDAPSYNDPLTNPQAAFVRQHYVLGGLVAMGTISQAAADAVDPSLGGDAPDAGQRASSARNQQQTLAELHGAAQSAVSDPAPHFVRFVEDELRQRLDEGSSLLDGTLTVTTTLDLSAQRLAARSVADGVARLGHGANNGALLMLDAHTGDILGMVGSASFSNADIGGQFNVVTAQRQPGSSFKPYVYAEGFATGRLNPGTTLDDTASESARLGGVLDFDHDYLGQISAAEALLQSRNIATEQAMQRTGVANVIDFAHSVGIGSPLADNLSTAIGSSAVRMIDHAAGYAAVANGGTRVVPRAILRVVDARGNVVVDQGAAVAPGPRVMSPEVACTVTGILTRYPQTWGLGFDHPTAGKSGTTDNFVDAWYMAYTPDWVVATWAGHTTANGGAEVGMDGVYGTTMAQAVTVPFVNGLGGPWHRFSCRGIQAQGEGNGGGGGHGHGHGNGDGNGNGDGGGG